MFLAPIPVPTGVSASNLFDWAEASRSVERRQAINFCLTSEQSASLEDMRIENNFSYYDTSMPGED